MSREMTPFERYIDDLEEELITGGHLGLFHFSWGVRGALGLSADQSPAAVDAVARRGYDYMTSHYALHLEWFTWPTDTGVPADPEVVLDFDSWRDPDSSVQLPNPHLALVPDDLDMTADIIEKKWAALAAEVRGTDPPS